MQNDVDLLSNLAHWRATSATVVLLLLFFPFSHASPLEDFSFSDLTSPSVSSANAIVSGVSIDFGDSSAAWSLSGSLQILQEFRENDVDALPVTVSGDEGTQEAFSGTSTAEIELLDFSFLMIAPNEALSSFEASNIEASPGKGVKEWQFGFDDARIPPTISLSNQVHVEASSLDSLELTGNFQISMWESLIHVDNETYWSGTRIVPFEEGLEPLAEQGVGTSREQVLHVIVENGTLTIPRIESKVELFFEEVTLIGLDGVTFSDARTLAGEDLGVVESNSSWSSTILGGASLIAQDFDGVDVSFTGAQPGSERSVVAELLIAIALAGILAFAYSNSNWRGIRVMERDLERGQYEKVAARKIRRLLRSKHGRKASLFRATSLLALGLFKEAGLFLASLSFESRMDPATYHFLFAHSLASQGEKEEASRHLVQCLALEPSYKEEADAIPVLKTLLSRYDVAQAIMSDSYS
ncbi:MAG: tetratricopeptide repeat protein [Thermoplasmatota archaeon]